MFEKLDAMTKTGKASTKLKIMYVMERIATVTFTVGIIMQVVAMWFIFNYII